MHVKKIENFNFNKIINLRISFEKEYLVELKPLTSAAQAINQ